MRLLPPDLCPLIVEPLGPEDDVAPLLGDHTHNSTHIVVTRGDYAALMEKIVKNLEQAKVPCTSKCTYNAEFEFTCLSG